MAEEALPQSVLRKLGRIGFGELGDTQTEVAYHLTVLAMYHPKANCPDRPYSGVNALFNADLHTGEPGYAPREHWDVISPYEIRHRSIKEIQADAHADSQK